MNEELSNAAEGGEILTPSQPKTLQAPEPGLSKDKIVRVAFSDQGRWAPTRRQARPSRIRYFARSWTSAGMSESMMDRTQLLRRPVGPVGSVGGLMLLESELDVAMVEW